VLARYQEEGIKKTKVYGIEITTDKETKKNLEGFCGFYKRGMPFQHHYRIRLNVGGKTYLSASWRVLVPSLRAFSQALVVNSARLPW